ncbi:MAG: nitroreductase family protein [Chloroflexota bacterium]|nr:nitroreductase family protein [Chloroflexota bacterium]
MNDSLERVRPLIRTRQYRQFTDEPVSDEILHALTEVARWSGSSRNTQPWRFIVLRDQSLIRELWQAGVPQTRSLETATAAIAVSMPQDEGRAAGLAYDEGRAAERILIAASMLGIGAGICWVRADVRPRAAELLGLADDRFVRTIVSIGHPAPAARAPKSAPGQARLPAQETVDWR